MKPVCSHGLCTKIAVAVDLPACQEHAPAHRALARAIWRKALPDYRTKRGDAYHPATLRLDAGVTTLVPLLEQEWSILQGIARGTR